jgi:Reverse transcriptase (RNA-dependent DNA polymerase)
MTLPPGYKNENNTNLVCRPYKLIYGLKQSSQASYGKLSSYLIECKFKISSAGYYLFVKHGYIKIAIVLVYVDGIIINDNN